MSADVSAAQFVERLAAQRSAAQAQGYQGYFKTGAGEYGEGDQFMGVRMGQVFALAKAYLAMPLSDIELLLERSWHEVRAGALSIMDKQARRTTTPAARRKDVFDLYLRRHDRINNWDLVDLGAPYVVGGYVVDTLRDRLYALARSHNMWERRTAIVSTAYFLRRGEVADTFTIAEILLTETRT